MKSTELSNGNKNRKLQLQLQYTTANLNHLEMSLMEIYKQF